MSKKTERDTRRLLNQRAAERSPDAVAGRLAKRGVQLPERLAGESTHGALLVPAHVAREAGQ